MPASRSRFERHTKKFLTFSVIRSTLARRVCFADATYPSSDDGDLSPATHEHSAEECRLAKATTSGAPSKDSTCNGWNGVRPEVVIGSNCLGRIASVKEKAEASAKKYPKLARRPPTACWPSHLSLGQVAA